MGKEILVFVSFFLLIGVSSYGGPKKHKMERKLEREILDMKIKLNQEKIATLVFISEERRDPIPIYALGGDWVEDYIKRDRKLDRLRKEFEAADDDLRVVLCKDSLYDKKMSPSSKMQVYNRLHETSQEYREAREIRDKALTKSNAETLKHLAAYYRSKRLIMDITPILDGWDLELINPEIGLLRIKLMTLEKKYYMLVK